MSKFFPHFVDYMGGDRRSNATHFSKKPGPSAN
jgi:hypothetical protein